MEEGNITTNPTLHLTVLSCRGLKAFNFFRKLSLYATVSLVSGTGHLLNQPQTTGTDREVRGREAKWNHCFTFDLESTSEEVFIKLEVRCEGGNVLWDRTVGKARVPLKELVDELGFDGVVRKIDHRVKGQHDAVLECFYELKGMSGKKTKKTTAESRKLRYYSSFGTQFAVENLVQYPIMEVGPGAGRSRDIYHGDVNPSPALVRVGIFSSIPSRTEVSCFFHRTVSSEEQQHEQGQSPPGLKLTGYRAHSFGPY